MSGPKVLFLFRIYKDSVLVREERICGAAVKIGTIASAQLRLEDETVSRLHAVIEVGMSHDVYIVDLGSRGGTFVNGLKCVKRQLQSGDMIGVGATLIEIVIGEWAVDDLPESCARAA